MNQAHGCEPGTFPVQVIQYLVNDRLIFNTAVRRIGQYLYPATTVGANLNINIEYPLEALGPVHRSASLCRGFF